MSATTWPCDNYTDPETCLTAGSTTRCDQCRESAALPSPPPPDHLRGCTHAACCNYRLCAHPACCGYPIDVSTTPARDGCANYSPPVTCLSAPSSETGRCDHCQKEARDA